MIVTAGPTTIMAGRLLRDEDASDGKKEEDAEQRDQSVIDDEAPADALHVLPCRSHETEAIDLRRSAVRRQPGCSARRDRALRRRPAHSLAPARVLATLLFIRAEDDVEIEWHHGRMFAHVSHHLVGTFDGRARRVRCAQKILA